jgi:hypothetical protein
MWGRQPGNCTDLSCRLFLWNWGVSITKKAKSCNWLNERAFPAAWSHLKIRLYPGGTEQLLDHRPLFCCHYMSNREDQQQTCFVVSIRSWVHLIQINTLPHYPTTPQPQVLKHHAIASFQFTQTFPLLNPNSIRHYSYSSNSSRWVPLGSNLESQSSLQ